MAHPHPQGPQPPASHVVPGAPGAVGPFPYMIEPPPLIPGLFVAEAIGAIRGGFNTQNLIIQDQYHAVNYGYTEMNKRFEEYVRQTDKILAEQHGRFERKLDDLRKEMRQFDTSQTAAIANLGARLNLLQDSTQASRDAMVSEIATIAKTMGHGFDGLAAMMRNGQYVARNPPSFESGIPVGSASLEAFPSHLKLPDGPSCVARNSEYESCFDRTRGTKGTPTPTTQSRTDPEVDINTTHTPTDHSSIERGGLQDQPVEPIPIPTSPSTANSESEEDRFYGWGTPQTSTPVSPTIDMNDVAMVRASIPEVTTPTMGYDLLQDSLFNTASPLTSMNSPCSSDRDEQTPATSSDDTTSTFYLESPTTTRKRKRVSSRRSAVKSPRRGRKPQSWGNQEAVYYPTGLSEGSHMDPLIWPLMVEDGANSQKYILCDQCAKGFHFSCVGLREDHEDGSPWVCPLCTQDPTRDASSPPLQNDVRCCRPDCIVSASGEYYMEQLLGRCYVPKEGVVKYLVSYEGYPLDQCTWEPPANFSNDYGKINEFLERWADENPTVDIESLDPHETILLRPAYAFACSGTTWPGA